MKKLSLLIALCMLVTVGGVYATWNYSQGSVDGQHEHFTDKLAIINTTTTKGTILVDTSGLSITIDQADLDYNARLDITGEVVITFTPSPGVDTDVKAGIPLEFYLSVTDNYSYKGSEIYTIDTTTKVALTDVTTGSSDRVLKAVIPASTLAGMITLNPLVLPTVEDYTSFDAALQLGNIGINVCEVGGTVSGH